MEGIIINLLKDVQQDCYDPNNEIRDSYPNLIWAQYDRVTIDFVDKMEDYFILSNIRDDWTGSIQSLHLYVENEALPKFTYPNKDGVLISRADNAINEAPAFFCVASFKLDYHIKNMIEWSNNDGTITFNRIIKKYISDFLKPYSKSSGLDFEIYNSLGAEDFVIIFLADSIKCFASAIESLRQIKYRTDVYEDGQVTEKERNIFATTYSFTGLNNTNKICEPDLDALVSLTIKSGNKIVGFTELLKGKGIEVLKTNHCFGEYDIRLQIKSSRALMMEYLDKGILTATNEEYKKYIYQSQTTWIYDGNELDNIHPPCKPIRIASKNTQIMSEICNTTSEFEDDIKRFKQIIQHEVISKIPHFKEECRILLAEYKRHMNTSFIMQWWVDMKLQFQAFIASMEKFLDVCDRADDGGISAIENIIEDIKETYMHITQASRMFFEQSEMTHYYNGSYNNILKAYYGLIRFIISIGYSIPHDKGTDQSNLAFTISFDMKPKINSTLRLLTPYAGGNRFISFNLPYAALYNMPKYLVYLIHEVFHYIAPVNRTVRNKLIFKVCTDMYLRHMLYIFYLKVLQDDTEKCDNVSGQIIKDIIAIYFNSIIHSVIDSVVSTGDNLNGVMSATSEYFTDALEKFYLGKDENHKIDVVTLLSKIIFSSLEYFKYEDKFVNLLTELSEKYNIDKQCKAEVVLFKIKAFANDMNHDDYLRKISQIANNIAETFKTKFSGNSIDANIQEVCEGLSEAVCDLYIINLLDLQFPEYIESLIVLFDEISYLKNLNSATKSDSLLFRIGVLVDVYNIEKDSEKWIREQLEQWKKITHISEKEDIARCINEYYCNYRRCYGAYADMFVQYLNNMDLSETAKKINDLYGSEAFSEWKSNISVLRSFYSKYRSAKAFGEKDDELLTLNLEMIEFFQSQKPIHQQYKKLKKNRKSLLEIAFTDAVNEPVPDIEIVVSDLSQYIDRVTQAVKRLTKAAEDSGTAERDYSIKMWFRGVCNSSYTPTPSIYRSVPENLSLYAYQTALFKEVHSRLAGYPDLFKHQMTNCVEQIACMQHYGVPTNFLDFSTDFFTALHFALNPDDEDDKKRISDAAVYILHPVLFNKAMLQMSKIGIDESLMNTLYPINCSSVLEQKFLEDYIPLDCSIEKVKEMQKEFIDKKESFKAEKNGYKYPTAIIIPRTNDRIRSQYGTFVVFPLDSLPEVANDKKKQFNYLALDELQRRYLAADPKHKHFMEKIVIASGCTSDLRSQLVSLGITQDKMYPELDNILLNSQKTVLELLK